LRLTGRLKEIFKTSKGKYVAPAPIENRLAVHSRIEQVCVVGDGLSAPLGLCVLSAIRRRRGRVCTQPGKLLEEVNPPSTSTSVCANWWWSRTAGRWKTVF
jgi:long-subunit acyl-CoA synthetase (AMP-forming)